jgi:hypothetical protein
MSMAPTKTMYAIHVPPLHGGGPIREIGELGDKFMAGGGEGYGEDNDDGGDWDGDDGDGDDDWEDQDGGGDRDGGGDQGDSDGSSDGSSWGSTLGKFGWRAAKAVGRVGWAAGRGGWSATKAVGRAAGRGGWSATKAVGRGAYDWTKPRANIVAARATQVVREQGSKAGTYLHEKGNKAGAYLHEKGSKAGVYLHEKKCDKAQHIALQCAAGDHRRLQMLVEGVGAIGASRQPGPPVQHAQEAAPVPAPPALPSPAATAPLRGPARRARSRRTQNLPPMSGGGSISSSTAAADFAWLSAR